MVSRQMDMVRKIHITFIRTIILLHLALQQELILRKAIVQLAFGGCALRLRVNGMLDALNTIKIAIKI